MSLALKVLHDAIGMVVSLEVANGEVYTGVLSDLDDTMNARLTDVTKTMKSGNKVQQESAFIRGGMIVFFVLPDNLKASPVLLTAGKVVPKSLDGRGAGKGFGSRKRTRE